MSNVAGVLLSRLPTLAVIALTALFFAMFTLAVILPKAPEERHSMRAKREAAQALREANESVQAAVAIPMPPIERTEESEEPLPTAAHDMSAAQPTNSAETTAPVAAQLAATIPEQQAEAEIRLPPAPDMAVAEKTADGAFLPVIADDGRRPWQVYGRPFAARQEPHIAIIVAGLGADRNLTNAVLEQLPGSVTLAIDALWARQDDLFARARKAGHETILVIPAEPFDYPNSDPGPETLLTNLPAKENLARLNELMKKASGYVGITTLTGTRFLNAPKAVQILLEETSRRGLSLLDTRITERGGLAQQASQMMLPVAAVDFRINLDMSPMAIDQVLAQAEYSVKKSGKAVCLVMATPLAIDRLNRWLQELPKQGIRVAPFTAILR